MLDKSILNQLNTVYNDLESSIELVYFKSSHGKQSELISMLSSIASVSERISISENNSEKPFPHFKIKVNGKENGISFTGIPSGHEFSTLVLAILNSDHKGKLPDNMIIERIKNLKGKINLKTFKILSKTS